MKDACASPYCPGAVEGCFGWFAFARFVRTMESVKTLLASCIREMRRERKEKKGGDGETAGRRRAAPREGNRQKKGNVLAERKNK